MTNNDILKRLRYALNYNDVTMIAVFRIAGVYMMQADLAAVMKKDDEEGFVHFSRSLLESFLDGLIIHKRGPRGDGASAPLKKIPLTNNVILRKLKIAMSFKDDDMIEVMKLGGTEISKSELSSFFRAEGHPHFKECHDQFLRNFIKGLTLYTRK
ncbi:MAG: DUF1456 family protein [Spirochaetota bacterium]